MNVLAQNDLNLSPKTSLIESLGKHHVMIELTLDGHITEVSERYLSLLDCSREQVLGRPLVSLISNSKPQMVWDSIKNNFTHHFEFSVPNMEKVETWLTGCFHHSSFEPGKIIFLGNDITELKDELMAREKVMNLTSIVSEADLKGNIVTINDKFCQVSKYSREELLGKPHNTTRHPDMESMVFKDMWKTIGSGDIFRGVVKNRAKDGSSYYVDAVITPILGKNGKPRKYLGIRYEITETEVERQNMHGILKAINESFSYLEYSLEGHITNANEMLCSKLGRSLTEIKGKRFDWCCEIISSLMTDVWKAVLEGKSQTLLLKRTTSSQTEVFYQCVLAPVTDEMGRVFKVIELSTDVTELNRMLSFIRSTSKEVDEVYRGIESVSVSIEEMVASIKDISRSTNESYTMSKNTLSRAQASNELVTKLGTSSCEVGDVIKVISSIAQQTNLLALNATIEAARAGEAGRGFAVVANEVKELARQTAKATNDITNKISTMQSDTQSAITSIGSIFESVEKLSSVSNVIASAVEEQTATTAEIARVMNESKRGVERIEAAIRMSSETKI